MGRLQILLIVYVFPSKGQVNSDVEKGQLRRHAGVSLAVKVLLGQDAL